MFEYAIKSGKDKGYALVVGDKRIEKVLILAEKGSLGDTAFIEPLKLYIQSIPFMITADLADYYGLELPKDKEFIYSVSTFKIVADIRKV